MRAAGAIAVDRADPESLREHSPHGPDEPGPPPPAPVEHETGPRHWTEWPPVELEQSTCPRCGHDHQARFYGPCEGCRVELRQNAQVPRRSGAPLPEAGHVDEPPTTVAAPADGPADLSTKRRRRNYQQRPAVFVPVPATVGELLETLTPAVRRVYVIGDKPPMAELLRWALGELPDGWEHDRGRHFLEGNLPVLKYRRDRQRVEVHRAAAWFGEGNHEPEDCRSALDHLGRLLAAHFDGATVLATPATTGREAFLRTIPHGATWPVLDDATQELIRTTGGQGRIELVGRSCDCGHCQGFAGDELPALVEYDGRLMYAALCWGLPIGPVERDERPTFEGRRRGRYRVTFTVPDGWRHVGLLPVKLPSAGEGWHYPNAPGSSWETWADGAELLIAERNGWAFQVHERLLFDTATPLDQWSKRFVKLRQVVAHQAAVGVVPDAVAQLVSAAVRNVLLHAIGAFHGGRHVVTMAAPVSEADQVPAGARNVRLVGDAIVWGEPMPQRWAELAHPEWSAAIWARARARLLAGPRGVGALAVPASAVVAFRTDALYVTERQPSWEAADDGGAGRLRPKRVVPGPLPAPRSHVELLRRRAHGQNA